MRGGGRIVGGLVVALSASAVAQPAPAAPTMDAWPWQIEVGGFYAKPLGDLGQEEWSPGWELSAGRTVIGNLSFVIGLRELGVHTTRSTSDGGDPVTVYTEGYHDVLAGVRYVQPVVAHVEVFGDVRAGRATFSLAEPFFAGGLADPVVENGPSFAVRGGLRARYRHVGISVGVDYSFASFDFRDDGDLGTFQYGRNTRAEWLSFETALQLAF